MERVDWADMLNPVEEAKTDFVECRAKGLATRKSESRNTVNHFLRGQ